MEVACDYCGNAARLVGGDVIYPHRPDPHPTQGASMEWAKRLVASLKEAEKAAAEGGAYGLAQRLAKMAEPFVGVIADEDHASMLADAAGIEAATLERAAQECDEQQKEPECPERASYCAAAIRALKPKE